MKKKDDESKRVVSLNAILGIALLALSVVMIRSAFSQLFTSHIVGGVINAVGGLLFFAVSMTLLADLCKFFRKKDTIQEDSNDGC